MKPLNAVFGDVVSINWFKGVIPTQVVLILKVMHLAL